MAETTSTSQEPRVEETVDAPGAEACINAEIENIRTTLTHGEGK